jgi:MoaD family protein
MATVHVEILPWLSSMVLPDQHGRIELDVEVQGDTMQDLLETLAARYPQFAERVYDLEKRDTTDLVEITVNGQMLNFSETLSTPLKEGDTVYFLPAFVGG